VSTIVLSQLSNFSEPDLLRKAIARPPIIRRSVWINLDVVPIARALLRSVKGLQWRVHFLDKFLEECPG
jgi:hypothetical protein